MSRETSEMSTWLGLLSGVPLLYQTGLLHALVDPEVGEYSDERDEIDNPTAHRRARGNNLFFSRVHWCAVGSSIRLYRQNIPQLLGLLITE